MSGLAGIACVMPRPLRPYDSGDGDRSARRAEGGVLDRRSVGDDGKRMQIVIRIPFAALKKSDEWRANFFRIDRSAANGDEFSAWQPTMKTPPDFHVTAAFGTLRFA